MENQALNSIIAVFGEPAIYTRHGAGEATPIRAVFERKHVAVDTGIGVETSLNVPTILILLSEVAEPAAKDTVSIRGSTYTVTDVQRDGHGGAELVLRAKP